MTMPFTHKKDEVRATGTLEARTPGDQAVQVLLYVIIALVALACVLPFIYVVAGSFATERELTERPFFLIPQDVSLNAYQYILKQGDVFRGLKNSVIVTVIGTLINMFVSCTIATRCPAPTSRAATALSTWSSSRCCSPAAWSPPTLWWSMCCIWATPTGRSGCPRR